MDRLATLHSVTYRQIDGKTERQTASSCHQPMEYCTAKNWNLQRGE